MNSQRGQFDWEHLLKMQKGIEFFNVGKFWECHEELEHHWMEADNTSTRYIYWAVIQVATTLLHYHNGNLAGARGQIGKAKEKFSKATDTSYLLEKNLNWSELKATVEKIPLHAELRHFDSLAAFTFKDPHHWTQHSSP